MLSMPTGLLVLALLGQAAGFAEIPKGAAETLRESRTAASPGVIICEDGDGGVKGGRGIGHGKGGWPERKPARVGNIKAYFIMAAIE